MQRDKCSIHFDTWQHAMILRSFHVKLLISWIQVHTTTLLEPIFVSWSNWKITLKFGALASAAKHEAHAHKYVNIVNVSGMSVPQNAPRHWGKCCHRFGAANFWCAVLLWHFLRRWVWPEAQEGVYTFYFRERNAWNFWSAKHGKRFSETLILFGISDRFIEMIAASLWGYGLVWGHPSGPHHFACGGLNTLQCNLGSTGLFTFLCQICGGIMSHVLPNSNLYYKIYKHSWSMRKQWCPYKQLLSPNPRRCVQKANGQLPNIHASKRFHFASGCDEWGEFLTCLMSLVWVLRESSKLLCFSSFHPSPDWWSEAHPFEHIESPVRDL